VGIKLGWAISAWAWISRRYRALSTSSYWAFCGVVFDGGSLCRSVASKPAGLPREAVERRLARGGLCVPSRAMGMWLSENSFSLNQLAGMGGGRA
jgi:hypothetical protein